MNDTQPPITDTSAASMPAQPAPMLESQARMWSMLVHIIAVGALVISGGFLSFVAPLVIWLMHRQRSALVDFHGRQNLNLQLTVLLTAVAAVVVGALTLGFGFLLTVPLWMAYGIYVFVISIVAGVKANNGEYYRIPFAITFIR